MRGVVLIWATVTVAVVLAGAGCTVTPDPPPGAGTPGPVVTPSEFEMSTARPPEAGGGPAKQYARSFGSGNAAKKGRRKAVALGYNLIDIDADDRQLAHLPMEAQAMVRAGNAGCGAFGLTWREFTRVVDRYARHPRVYGYFLADEPSSWCPDVLDEIKRRAAYIKARAPHQKRLVSAAAADYTAVSPARLGVDYVGIDAFGCRRGRERCDTDLIRREVERAIGAGIPRTAIIPEFQAFGQGCAKEADTYRLPSRDELIEALVAWHEMVPNPVFEAVYSWANREETACPTLADADGSGGLPDLREVFRRHNAWHNDGKHGDKLLEPTLR